jgi:hypothetical protein
MESLGLSLEFVFRVARNNGNARIDFKRSLDEEEMAEWTRLVEVVTW